MKLLLIGLLFSVYAFAGECGCKTKVVDVHEHKGMMCEPNEVMVGHEVVRNYVFCGVIECSCSCMPAEESVETALLKD